MIFSHYFWKFPDPFESGEIFNHKIDYCEQNNDYNYKLYYVC